MPVSTNPDWTQTVGGICASAAYELGAVGVGDSLGDSEETEMIVRLNSMLAKWSIEANLFRQVSDTVTITASTNPTELDSEIRNIRAIRYVQSATNKRWIAPWTRDQYMMLPNRAQTGTSPMAYYFAPQVGAGQLYLWPVPSADIDLEIDYDRKFYYAEGPDQELDLPPEWHEAVLYGLASRCAGIFGTTNLDPNKVQRCDAQAKASYEQMLDADRPDSYQFCHDSPVEAG